MERLATHSGPGHVGHDGLDLGLFDKGQCGRQSQQALSAAVMATLSRNGGPRWSHPGYKCSSVTNAGSGSTGSLLSASTVQTVTA